MYGHIAPNNPYLSAVVAYKQIGGSPNNMAVTHVFRYCNKVAHNIFSVCRACTHVRTPESSKIPAYPPKLAMLPNDLWFHQQVFWVLHSCKCSL